MKKVLIISYYWPPSGGAGVQRWLKFVKYLGDFGWEPILFIPENPHYPVIDESLKKDVPSDLEILSCPIWEPYSLYKRFIGIPAEKNIQHGFIKSKAQNPFKEKVSLWIRSNFFIPDARKFWIRPAYNYLYRHFSSNALPDMMISTGPPHSTHLIAQKLKRKLKIPWIADFRDPWTGIDYYHELMLTNRSDRKHHSLERRVLENADRVLAIGWNLEEELLSKGAKDTMVITNGYDDADFPEKDQIGEAEKDRFVLLHLGSLNKDRNSDVLWKAVNEIVQGNEELKKCLRIRLIGAVDHQVLDSIQENKLKSFLEVEKYIPHEKVNHELSQAGVLLLLLNNTPNIQGIITGKIFEYMASTKPILCIGSSSGDASKIIRQAQAGIAVDFDDLEKMKDFILQKFYEYKDDRLDKNKASYIHQFTRKNLTRQLVELMEEM